MASNVGNDWITTYWLMGVNPDYLGDASEKNYQSRSKKPRKVPELADEQHTLDGVLE